MSSFKETEIGRLPIDWKIFKLGDFAKTASGGTPSRSNSSFFQGNIAWVKSGELKDDIITKTEETISKDALDNSSTKLFPEGTLLIALYGATVGRTAILGIPAATNQAVCAIFPEKNIIHSSFLRYFLVHIRPHILKERYGGAQPNISQQILQNLRIAAPPINEQRVIAAVLSKIQAAAETQGKIVAKLKELKAATMAKLFREGLRREPLKSTEIGEMPASWGTARIGEWCEKPRYGYTQSANRQPVGPRFLRITDINEFGVDWASVPYCQCPKDILDEMRLASGDIVIARIGATTGKSFLIKSCPESIFASYLIRLRTKIGLDSAYLSYFLLSDAYWRQVDATKGNNLKGGMNASILSELVLPRPPLEEQRAIAAVLSKIQTVAEEHAKKKFILEQAFASMLHLLMTGRVRINIG